MNKISPKFRFKGAQNLMRSFHYLTVALMAAIGTNLFPLPVTAQIGSQQAGLSDKEVVIPVSLPLTGELQEKDKLFPARGGSVDWGLALSGGGIRSASYSIGAMKAMYDAGLFEQLDAISTVSGGGYAAYWLYGINARAPGDVFGDSAFSGDVYTRNICEIQRYSQMYSTGSMFKALFRSKGGAFENYAQAIHRTFGQDDEKLERRRISSFRDDMRTGKAPYLIINSSISSESLNALGKSIEITSEHLGNSILGYARWKDDLSGPSLRNVVAMSAAGIEFKLRQPVPNFSPKVLDSQVFLFDGGYSENLGALALISRGVSNVIVVDAEHDPEYEFGSYTNLKESLRRLDIDLSVDAIDVRTALAIERSTRLTKKEREEPLPEFSLQRGVLLGNARNRRTGRISKIYYLKMSRSQDIFPKPIDGTILAITKSEARNHALAQLYKEGRQIAEKKDAAIKSNVLGRKYTLDCSMANGFPVEPEMYKFLTSKYAYFINTSKKYKKLSTLGNFFVYDFPQLTTFDQSYFPDQMEAFMGLGYLQGLSLSNVIGPELQATRLPR